MEKRLKIFVVAGLSIILLQGAFIITWVMSKPKTAYIKTEDIYNAFEMKKNLEADLRKVQDARQSILDSLRLQLDMMSMELQGSKKNDTVFEHRFSGMRDYYFSRQEELRQENEAAAQQYTSQIWSQLNQYINDFGKQRNYQYIFGASGDGSLMFANDAQNITEEIKTYVNSRYKGQP